MSKESFNSFTTQTVSDKKSTPPNTKEHVPRYLRASTGSCHDLCKYGKHIAEESQLLAEKKKKNKTTKPDPTEKDKTKPLPKSKTPLSEGHQVSKLKTRVSYTSKATNTMPHVPSPYHKLRLSVEISASNRAVNPTQSIIVRHKSSKTDASCSIGNENGKGRVKGHEHEEMEEKKGAKDLLLNNVIEETASKLGGTNKSKVRALVGVFETVIVSFRDR